MEDINLNEALKRAVIACGGTKVVAAKFWPEKDIESSRRLLADCLNPDRPAHLTPEQTLLVLRIAREHGYHECMQFVCTTLDYAVPVPVEPRDELADLMRQYLQQREADAKRDDRLQRLLAQHLGVKSP